MNSPAIGVTWQVNPKISWYASSNAGCWQSCADSNNACLLPKAMASDPYLKKARTQTIEAGARGKWNDNLSSSAGAYRAVNTDDILFVSTSTGGAGYFTNFGKTQRQGLELGLAGKARAWAWSLDYALTDATYRSNAVIQSPNNSTRGDITTGGVNDDQIQIKSGNRLPGYQASSATA